MPNLPSLTTNEELLNRAILHAVFLERLKAHEVKVILEILTKAQDDAIEQIVRRIQNISARGYATSVATSRRLRFLARAIDTIIDKGFREIDKKLLADLDGIALQEAKFQLKVLGAVTPISFDYQLPNPTLLKAIATTRPMDGQLISAYLERLGKSSNFEVVRNIQAGLVLGETIPQISSRVKKTLKLKFNNQAATIARTAVNHVTTQARELTWIENKDIVKAVQWVSTLDARTSDICIALDGSIFRVGEGIRPPAHLNCRSTTVPVLKSFKELGIDLKEPPPGTRSAKLPGMTGQVPAKLTYKKWLRQQSVKIQDQVLGKERGRRFRAGKLKFDKPIYNGRPMTLKELGVIEEI